MPSPVVQVAGLSLEDRFVFCMAPVSWHQNTSLLNWAFTEFAHTYASGQPVATLQELMPDGPPLDSGEMRYMEDLYKVGGV